MAIGSNNVIHYFGTQDDLDSTSAAVADAAFSVQGDLTSWVNDDDAPMASVVLSCTFTTAPDANSFVNLFCRPLNINSTSDQAIPDANFQHTYLGSFPLNDVTTAQEIMISMSLPNAYASQQYEFYVENKSGQSLPAGWTLLITPKTVGAHA